MSRGIRIQIVLVGILLTTPWISYAQLMTNDGLQVTIESGVTVTVEGGFTNQTNGTNGRLDNDGVLQVEGDWNNNATGQQVTINPDANGSVEFTGTGPQALGGTRTTRFENLVINNTSSGVTLDEVITVLTSLTLTDGVVYTDATNLLVINDGAMSTSGTDDSFVDGPMKKIGNDNFDFPVGDGTIWAAIGIDNSGSVNNDTEFIAQYFQGAFSDRTTDVSLQQVSSLEYWTLSRSVNADDVPVTLCWGDADRSGIEAFTSDLVLARYDGADWTNEGQSAITATDPGQVSSNVVSDFSNLIFTFGSLDGSNPLPVELLFFDARRSSSGVELEWATITEKDNDFFTVEKSTDNVNWTPVLTIPGAGNSESRIDYSALDNADASEVTYYRLRQTDFDGTFSYSQVVAVDRWAGELRGMKAYPNPTVDVLFIDTTERNVEEFRITDLSGHDISQTVTIVFEQPTRRWKVDVMSLPPGIYAVQAGGDSFRFIKR